MSARNFSRGARRPGAVKALGRNASMLKPPARDIGTMKLRRQVRRKQELEGAAALDRMCGVQPKAKDQP